MNKKNILTTLPYLYFIGLLVWVVWDHNARSSGTEKSFLPLVFTLPFAAQLFLKNKTLDISLIAICGVFTLYMTLAFLSDYYDITTMTEKAKQFIIYGGLFTAVNYCLLYTSPSPRDRTRSRMPSSA